ncbi:MAG TPA: hypothetical protein VG273_00510 [Bryobacteraceae bacterium]|jgi:hypothetical protein|nr:hypothetical protein [Bryobacteraceae bacterium]
MNLSQRDRRALILLAVSLLVSAILYYGFPGQSTSAPAAATVTQDPALARQRLAYLRQVAATVPAREALLKQTTSDLASREAGVVQADTIAQGEAALLEIARRIGKEEQLDVRGGDFGAPKVFGDYALVYTTVAFECHIEQLVNFLADLAKEPELITPSEEHIASANPKEKTMSVRMVLAGVVPKKLIPEKKGLAAF